MTRFPPRRLLLWTLQMSCASVLIIGQVLLVSLWVTSYFFQLPPELKQTPPGGQRILDRDGQLLARRTTVTGDFSAPLSLKEASPLLVQATVAAEDQRFFSHPGIDLWAISRALLKAIYSRHPVSGASTITQQLARQTFDRPRTLGGKWQEMALAIAIERDLSKQQILEQYLNRVHFGPRVVGVKAAADYFFGKPISALDLAETATLVGLVRGPSLFDPSRRPNLARKERDRVLARLVSSEVITAAQAGLARSLAVEIHPRPPLQGAHHWVRLISRTRDAAVVHSTLHGPLQREVEALITAHQRALDAHHTQTTAAAAVVLDNQSGDVLAYVGSPDFFNTSDGGQNDGVLALRQPGSALKPFIYASAIDVLGYTPASLLPDEPSHFRAASGFYTPRNFDNKFRGQVRLRRALSNSLNIPAVYTLEKLGEQKMLTTLRALGLNTLDRAAPHYGPALALGDGEVMLVDLAAAYAALPRGGASIGARFTLGDTGRTSFPVFSAHAAALVSEMLSDDIARREAFGAAHALDLPFPVAVKTGTSKGYRDAWAVGYTRRFTVAVWAGNFDGRPTARMTGASAAGPLFHAIFMAMSRVFGPDTLKPRGLRPLHDVALREQKICLEGDPFELAHCSHTFVEVFAPASSVAVLSAQGDHSSQDLRVTYPKEGMAFRFDPAVPEDRQMLLLKATDPTTQRTTLFVNGKALPTRENQAEWLLRPGSYEVQARTQDERSEPVRFVVN